MSKCVSDVRISFSPASVTVVVLLVADANDFSFHEGGSFKKRAIITQSSTSSRATRSPIEL